MKSRPIVFAAIVIAVLIIIAILIAPPARPGFTSSDAINASLKDADQFAVQNYGDVQRQLSVFSVANSSGNWNVVIYLTVDPHSRCPDMQRLSYTLFPITRRNETIVTSADCHARTINFAPEAILDSYANSRAVQQLDFNGYAACAFSLPISDAAAQKIYCGAFDENSIMDFSSKNALAAGAWVVQWYSQGQPSHLVALDSSGRILAESASG